MSKRRILVVTDEPTLSSEVSDYLLKLTDGSENQLYEVNAITRGDDFAAHAHQWMPHMIMLDTSLDSTEALHDPLYGLLRQTTRTAHIPVIFFVSYDTRDEVFRDIKPDLEPDFLQKPVQIETLAQLAKTELDFAERSLSTNIRTGLAGYYQFDCTAQELLRHLNDMDPWTYIDLKLENFDSLEQAYGDTVGDQVLHTLRLMFDKALIERGTSDDFFGYIHNANFAIITFAENSKALVDRINERFRSDMNLQWEATAQGKKEKLRLKLGVATVSSTDEGFATPTELLAIAAHRRR
jgi:PleD family two-component response regulator